LSAWAPLGSPDYRRFWLGLVLASIAYWIHNVSASWLMKEWTEGDPFMVALVQTAISFPVMIMAIPAGVLADLFDRRRFLIFSQLWMLAASALMGAAIAFGMHNPVILLVLTAALGLGHAMKLPAQAAVVPELAGREKLSTAISLGSMAINGARVVGPALAGVILPLLGPVLTFFAACLGFGSYAGGMALWKRAPKKPAARGQRLYEVFAGGFRFAASSKPFQGTLLRCGLAFVVWAVVLAILPMLVADVDTFGQVYACFGVGGIVGALSYPYADRRTARENLMSFGVGLQAVGIAALAFVGQPLAMAAILAVIGAGSMYAMISVQTSAQMILPEELRARGMSLINMTMMGSGAIGSPIWGAIAKSFSPQASLLSAAVFSAVCLALTARTRITAAR
jgi:MFS family permease